MSALENMTLPAVGVLWAVVAVRLVGVARGGSTKAAVILGLFASMFTIKLTFVGDLIDAFTGVVGLQVFVRDCIGVLLAATAAHAVGSLVRARPSPRWMVLVTSGAILVSFGLMSYFFVAVGAERAGVVDITSASSEPAALGYWLSYLVPYGAFLLGVGVLALGDARRPARWTRGRTGLALFGAGALVGVLYAVIKVIVVLTVASSPFMLRHEVVLQGVPSFLAITLVAVGAATWTDVRLHDRYLLARLWREHRMLTRDQAGPRLPRSALAITERLDRRVVEIGEAVLRHQGGQVQTVPYLPDGPPSSDPAELLRQLVEARRSATGVRRTRFARLVTEILAPPNLGVIVLLALGLRDDALLWALVGALFVSVLPYAVVIIGVRRGIWRDRMLTDRRERLVPIISNVSFALLGFVTLLGSPAPRALPAFVGMALAAQIVLFAVTVFWKISFHSGVAAGVLVVTGLEFGWIVAAVLCPLVVLIAWSRVELREHTVAQVVAGAPVGAALLGFGYVATLGLL